MVSNSEKKTTYIYAVQKHAISKHGLLTPLESIVAPDARLNSRESCGYVNIPEVRIDTYSTRAPALRCSLENCEPVLG